MDLIERIAQFKYDSIRLKNLGSTKKANRKIGFFFVAGEPQISGFLEGFEIVIDLYKYMNRSLN
jgi:hypothetical protein